MQTNTETTVQTPPAQQPTSASKLGAVVCDKAGRKSRRTARHYAALGFKAGAVVSLGAMLLAFSPAFGFAMAAWIAGAALLGLPLIGLAYGTKRTKTHTPALAVVEPQEEAAPANAHPHVQVTVAAPLVEAMVQAEREAQWKQRPLPQPTHDAPTRLQ